MSVSWLKELFVAKIILDSLGSCLVFLVFGRVISIWASTLGGGGEFRSDKRVAFTFLLWFCGFAMSFGRAGWGFVLSNSDDVCGS